MNTSKSANRVLCVIITAVAISIAGCSGHGGSIVPSTGNESAPERLQPFSASGSFEQLMLQSGPTQYYELEDTRCCTASNIGSTGATGTYTSSNVKYSVSGPLQSETSTAIGLPGNNHTAAISMGVSLPTPSTGGAFTVEDWVFPAFTSTHVSQNAYYTIWGYDGAHRLLISNQSPSQGQLLMQFGATNVRSTKLLTANAWNQVVFVYNGTHEFLYINGALDSSLAVSGVSLSSAYWLGQYDTSANYKLDGRIGQHMVFPAALSASVIQNHFLAATSAFRPPTPSPTPTSNPIGTPRLAQMASGGSFAPTAITVKFGSTPSAGNVLLVFFHNNGTSTNGPITYAAPSGWVQLDLDTAHSANTYEAFYHVVKSGENNNYVFKPSCACREQVWSAVAFSGVNTASPIDRHGFTFIPKSSAVWTTPNETPSKAGDLAVVSMMPTTLGGQTWKNASGWTVDLGPATPWASEVLQKSQAGTTAVSETSTLSSPSYGYAAIVLLSPGSGGEGVGKVDWPTWGMKPTRNSYNPIETTLTTSNVGHLHRIWSTTAGGVFTDEPVIAANVTGTSEGTADLLYVGDAHANLYAMDANTGKIVWTKTLRTQFLDPSGGCADQPDGLYGIGGSPTIDRTRNLVYAVDGLGNLYAFDLATGTQKVGPVPMWPFRNGANITNDYGALNEDANAGVIYVPGGAHCGTQNYGSIDRYTISSGAVSHFYTEGGPPNVYGGIWGPGGAVIDPRNATNSSLNNIYFGTGYGPIGSGEYPYSVVRLTESLSVVAANNPVSATFGPDWDFGDTPLVFTPSASGCGRTLVAAESKNGILYLHDADNIGAGPLQTIRIGTVTGGGTNLGTAAYDPTRNLIYINNGSDSTDTTLSPPIRHGLVAFTVTSGCRLQTQVAWQQTVGPSNTDDGPPAPPTVANGVVYYADGPGTGCTPVRNPNCTDTGDFYAFDASNGSVLFHTTLPGPLFTPPVVVNGHVYLTTWNGGGPGIVYCFGL